MSKSLAEKAVSIQGKKYVLVSDRIIYFNEMYPEGSITTELLTSVDSQTIIVRALVRPDAQRAFSGHSQAVIGQGHINKTSALENAETSAVGRALAMMGIGVIDSVASVDEIKKATYTAKAPYSRPGATSYATGDAGEPFPTHNPVRQDQRDVDADIAAAFPDAQVVDVPAAVAAGEQVATRADGTQYVVGTISVPQTRAIYAMTKQLGATSKEDIARVVRDVCAVEVTDVASLSKQRASAIISALKARLDAPSL